MNEVSLSSHSQFVVFFQPRQRCAHCTRWAHIGLCEREEKHQSFTVEPVCYAHGYYDLVEDASAEERALEHESITRFIIWAMGDCGIATSIKPIPVETIPYYSYEEHNTDWLVKDGYVPKGWKSTHVVDSVETDVYVVYDFIDWSMSLYTNMGMVQL